MEPKKTFESIPELFSALSGDASSHSRRVSKYAELLFMELVASEEYTLNVKSRVRLRPELKELVGEAALYHDVGKALVPVYYQWEQPDWSQEEQALYARHAAAGAAVMEELIAAEGKGSATPARVNIINEGLSAHHERWDGMGFPNGTAGENTPVIARVIAVADGLDHMLMSVHTETPVETAVDNLMMDSGTKYDPVVCGLMYAAKGKIAKLFAQWSDQSRAIPQAPRIIRRKARRPMWLSYRQIDDPKTGLVKALEAKMCFRRGKDTVEFSDMAHLAKESKNAQDIGMAFLLEAADTARRMKACDVCGSFVALNTVPGFLKKRGAATAILKQFSDTDSDPSGVCLIVAAEDWINRSPTLAENCKKLTAAGMGVMVSGAPLSEVTAAELKKYAITALRIGGGDADTAEKQAGKLKTIAAEGVMLLADGVEKHRARQAVADLGFFGVTGDLMGMYMSEDDIILGEIALREQLG